MIVGQVGKICFSRIIEGKDLAEEIEKIAEKSNVRSGVFLAIGSLKKVTLGYYKKGKYEFMELNGPLEIASCMGNISIDEKGEIITHPHIVVSDEKGVAFGGHLMKGSIVGATAELVIIEGVGVKLQRVLDNKTGLNLWKLS